MAINTGNHDKIYSPNHIMNMGFDREFQLPTTQLVQFDPLTNGGLGGLKRVTTNAMGEYVVNDIEETGGVTYLGKEDMAGDWFIQKIDETTGTSIRFATIKNNASITSYTNAWTDRATLTYGTYAEAF